MSQMTQSEVYRVALDSRVCASAFALLELNIREVEGVSAVSVTDDNTLIVVAAAGVDIYDALVCAVVNSGFDPLVVTVGDLERLIDPAGLPIGEALRLGLIDLPKEPVRAMLQTVQRLRIEVTDGYDPDNVIVQAGVPIEIEFSEGHGCLGAVVFDGLGVQADLENGGALVKLPALEPGTYAFRCGMDMVHGTLVAEQGEEQ